MKKFSGGFTIVELIISIIVIGIVVTALSTLFLGIQRTQTQSNYKESATRAAQREIESLRNNNFISLVAGEDIDFNQQKLD